MIKNIKISFTDSDYIRAWYWISLITFESITKKNFCEEKCINSEKAIESFIRSLIPASYFHQYPDSEEITQSTYINWLNETLKLSFNVNTDISYIKENYIYMYDECFIIDLENNEMFWPSEKIKK